MLIFKNQFFKNPSVPFKSNFFIVAVVNIPIFLSTFFDIQKLHAQKQCNNSFDKPFFKSITIWRNILFMI